MRRSIRSRLLFGLTAAIATLWVLVIATTYLGARREVGSLFDTQLEQSARVATRTMLGLSADPAPDEALKEQYKKNLVIQVWDDEGTLIVNSMNAPEFPLSTRRHGFADTLIEGERWRIFSFYDAANGLTIRAGEPYRPRDYLTGHVVVQTLYPVIVGLPIVTFLIWFVVGRGFMPMRRLAAEVHRRGSDNLEQIVAPYAPSEVRPLVEELNVLLARLKRKIDNERHFIGDAAHELRTPLSGLRVQAQVAKDARGARERDAALNNILTGVDRAGHLVNQLLTLSRLDESESLPTEDVDLKSILQRVLVDVLPVADQRSVELSLAASDRALVVDGNPDALYVLIRNLVDNAVKYSPRDREVALTAAREERAIRLSVTDRGPGIPEAEREKVFDRFHRRHDGAAYGSGLGLSIARRVIDLHHGSIRLCAPPQGGLTVEIELPTKPGADKGAKRSASGKPSESTGLVTQAAAG